MTDRPLYLRIADEIADDIRSGRLAEGQPAPSTRRIVRDWNVAMATATKVIGALRAAGLVETIPGRGTIVRRRNKPATVTTRRARLTQREIVETGVRIADADGLPFVTMRRVADSLGRVHDGAVPPRPEQAGPDASDDRQRVRRSPAARHPPRGLAAAPRRGRAPALDGVRPTPVGRRGALDKPPSAHAQRAAARRVVAQHTARDGLRHPRHAVRAHQPVRPRARHGAGPARRSAGGEGHRDVGGRLDAPPRPRPAAAGSLRRSSRARPRHRGNRSTSTSTRSSSTGCSACSTASTPRRHALDHQPP